MLSFTFLKKKKFLIITLVVVLAITGFFVSRRVIMRAAAKNSLQLRTAFAMRGDLNVTISGSGPAYASESKDVTAEVDGTLVKSYFEEGDSVKKGDLLFELTAGDYEEKLEQIEISLREAEITYEESRRKVENLNMFAPFSGKVTDIAIEKGVNVSDNTSVLTLTDMSKLKVILPFSSKVINRIHEGDTAIVYLPDYMEFLEGKVASVDEKPYSLSGGSLVNNVEIIIDNPGGLEEGVKASAELRAGTGGEKILSLETGELEFVNKKVMKANTSGTVKEILVKENQEVEEGTLLVIFENEQIILNNKSNAMKVRNLKKQLEDVQKQLENCKIYAPIDGVIVWKSNINEGDSVRASTVLCTISNPEKMEFEISVDELDIPKLKVGQKVRVTVDALTEYSGAVFEGTVKRIAMTGSTQSGVTVYPVIIEISNPEGIKEGMNCNADIYIVEKENVLYVPIEAVTSINGRSVVMVMSEEGNENVNRMIQQGRNAFRGQYGARVENSEGDNSDGNNVAGSDGNNSENPGGNNFQRRTGDNSSNSGTASNMTDIMQNFLRRNSLIDSRIADYYKNATPVFIETGVNNEEYIEVVSGLEEGDIVILPPILQSSTSNNTNNNMFFGGGMSGGMSGGMGGFQMNIPGTSTAPSGSGSWGRSNIQRQRGGMQGFQGGTNRD